MNEFFTFAGNHPLLTWFLAWGIWPVCWAVQAVLTAPFAYPFKAYNRSLRAKNIAAHGWPNNPYMDADGDLVYPKQDEKK